MATEKLHLSLTPEQRVACAQIANKEPAMNTHFRRLIGIATIEDVETAFTFLGISLITGEDLVALREDLDKRIAADPHDVASLLAAQAINMAATVNATTLLKEDGLEGSN